jgi:hypothetical protein
VALGYFDAQGVWIHGGSDPAAPAPDLMNRTGESVSDQLALIRTDVSNIQAGASAPWTSYTSTLRGSISNPNIGSTGTAVGRYRYSDRTIRGVANVTISGTGVSAGSGTYDILLPGSVMASDQVIGTAVLFDASSSTRYVGAVQATSAGKAVMTFDAMTSEWGSAGGPIIIAAGDFIRIAFQYETTT